MAGRQGGEEEGEASRLRVGYVAWQASHALHPLPWLRAVTPLRSSCPNPQDSYLSDVYEFYMKHLEDEGPIADFK